MVVKSPIIMKLPKIKTEKGQSLVEMAIITPLLIFFLLGVFEVGAAIRNYVVLVNVNREITRFAVRPGYLNFSTVADVQASYNRVRDWAASSVSEQLNLDFRNTGDINDTGSTTLIISHLVVDTGLPCEDIASNPDDCDCEAFESNPSYANNFTRDDVIIHPGMTGQEYQAERFGPPETVTGSKESQIDYDTLSAELAAKNNKFNCEIIKKGGVPSSNNVIVTEVYHDQPQLFGFPLISNPFTDPVPLYTHTTMRLISAARSTGGVEGNITSNIDTVGQVCFAYPLIVKQDTIDNPDVDGKIDIFDGKNPPGGGGGGGDWGWLAWNPAEDDEQYLGYELTYSQMAINDYTNANDSTDHDLSIGDNISSLAGLNTGVNNPTNHHVDDLVGKEIIIPVWDPDVHPYDDATDSYKITGFARVMIESTDDIDIPGKQIKARYLGPPTEGCQVTVP